MQWDIHICPGAYARNVKWKYTSACVDNVDCIEFILGIYTDIVVRYLHMNVLEDLTFEGHILYWNINGNSMVIKSCIFFCCFHLHMQ